MVARYPAPTGRAQRDQRNFLLNLKSLALNFVLGNARAKIANELAQLELQRSELELDLLSFFPQRLRQSAPLLDPLTEPNHASVRTLHAPQNAKGVLGLWLASRRTQEQKCDLVAKAGLE